LIILPSLSRVFKVAESEFWRASRYFSRFSIIVSIS